MVYKKLFQLKAHLLIQFCWIQIHRTHTKGILEYRSVAWRIYFCDFRLIVAVNVAESASSRSLHLRHTTVMPNIHGFSSLMALLFCPSMEPKPLADGSRFGAILCGLGAHQSSHRSMYPAHDMVITFDTELSQVLLNEVSYA